MTPRLATFSVFMINGAMIGTWVAHIPWLQDHLGISKATLGLCLLCMAAGALISMPVTGHVLDRRPSAAVTRASALVFCLMLPLPLLATSPYMLAAILFVFGAVNGVMDVAMNAHGVALERGAPKPIMSSLHGGWSLGGFAAAGTVVIAATAGVDPRVESLAVGIALWLAALWVTRRLGSASAHSKTATGFALPSRAVILIGGLCFLAMMIEGGIADWSGIYLRHDIGASTAAAAMAFTGFSLGMAVARLGGDALNERLGAGRLLRGGMALVAITLGAVLLIGEIVPVRDRLRVLRPRDRECGAAAVQRCRPARAAEPVARRGVHPRLHGLHRRAAAIGILSDQVGLPKTFVVLVLAALTVAVLGARATASAPARSRG